MCAGVRAGVCVLGQLGSHPLAPSGMPEVGARTVASEFVSKQSGIVRYLQVRPALQSTVNIRVE